MTSKKLKDENTAIPFAIIPLDDCDTEHETAAVQCKAINHNGTPVSEAILNLLTDILGAGLLALPYVILKGGIVSIASMIIIPAICYYTGQILIDCLYENTFNGVPIRVRASFKEIGEACWGRYGGFITVAIQTTQLVLLAASYIVLSASLMSHLTQYLGLGDRVWIIIAAVVALPMIFAKDLSQVAWLSLLSITSLLAAAVVITGFGYSQSAPLDPSELTLGGGDLLGIPLSLSIITFSYVSHGMLPTIEEHMAERSKFKSMLAITYMFCTTLRTLFAINGFFSFYDNIHEIISNSLPIDSPIHYTVNGLLVGYSILCYPFVAVTIIHIVESSIVPKDTREQFSPTLWYIGSRVVLSIVTIATALVVPHFAVLLAISGNLAGCMAFILPTLFHLRLKFHELTIASIAFDCFVFVAGLVISGVGMVFAFRELVEAY